MNDHRWLLGYALLLVGCKAHEEPLTEYLSEVEFHRQQVSTPRTSILPFQAFHYAQQGKREPFSLPQDGKHHLQSSSESECWQPKLHSNSEIVKEYLLSQLRFKGVISREGEKSALVQTPTGKIVRINVGQHLGSQGGQVTQITDDYLLIKETLPDGFGCWLQSYTKLALP